MKNNLEKGSCDLRCDEIRGGADQQLLFTSSAGSTRFPLQWYKGSFSIFLETNWQSNLQLNLYSKLIFLRAMFVAATRSWSTTSATTSRPSWGLRGRTATWRRWWRRARTGPWWATDAAIQRSRTNYATRLSLGWNHRTLKWRPACSPCSSTTSGSSSPSCPRRRSSGWRLLRIWGTRRKWEKSSLWNILWSLKTTINAVSMWVQRLFGSMKATRQWFPRHPVKQNRKILEFKNPFSGFGLLHTALAALDPQGNEAKDTDLCLRWQSQHAGKGSNFMIVSLKSWKL